MTDPSRKVEFSCDPEQSVHRTPGSHYHIRDEQWEYNWLAGFICGIAAGALLVHLLT